MAATAVPASRWTRRHTIVVLKRPELSLEYAQGTYKIEVAIAARIVAPCCTCELRRLEAARPLIQGKESPYAFSLG
jgi:hypothetical protein